MPDATPVVLASQRGSAVEFTLPKGWRQTSATLSTTTFGHDGEGTVSVLWSPVAYARNTSAAAIGSFQDYARSRGKSVEYACKLANHPVTGTSDSYAETGEYPCGHAGSPSLFLPLQVPRKPAPAGGRHTLQLHSFGALNDEEWVIAYDTRSTAVDPAVSRAVAAATLHLTSGPIKGFEHLTGSRLTPAAVPLPDPLGAPADSASTTLPGAGATNACRLISPSDTRAVYAMTGDGGATNVKSAVGAASLCQADLQLAASGLSSRGSATVDIALFRSSLADTVADVERASGLSIRGTSTRIGGVPAFEATSVSPTAPYTVLTETYLAAAPDVTVRLSVVGPASSTTGWERAVLDAEATAVAQRLRTGSLLRAPSPAHKTVRGIVTSGVQYGTAMDHAKTPCGLVDVAAVRAMVRIPLHAEVSAYPPSCSTARDHRLGEPLLSISVDNGAVVSLTDGPFPMLSKKDKDALTATSNGITVYLDKVAPAKDLGVLQSGFLSAYVAINGFQYSWVTVQYLTHRDYVRASRIRSAVVADLTERAAAGD